MARAGESWASYHALTFLREVDTINMRRRTRMVELVATTACGGSPLEPTLPSWVRPSSPESDDVRDSPALNVAGLLQLNGAGSHRVRPTGDGKLHRFFPTLTYGTSVKRRATPPTP